MLTDRQKRIYQLLREHEKTFINGSWLSKEVGCSIKTLQKDIKILKEYLSSYDIDIVSSVGKGYMISSSNESLINDSYKLLFDNQTNNMDFNDQTFRINYILKELLKRDDYIKSEELLEEMYISRSSFSNTIKIVRKILDKYNLIIEAKPNYGMRIVGSEKDKRACIVKENLDIYNETNFIDKERISIITDIVINNLMKAKYRISDMVLQNLVLHICVSIQRMENNIYISDIHDIQNDVQEKKIASKIIKDLSNIFNFDIKNEEINYLALNLLGKRSYDTDEFISAEIDQFVNNMLQDIKERTTINFFGDVELKISLSLHLIPLFVRLESNMQLKNILTQDIRTNYPLAYDVAIIASSYITKIKKQVLTDDEIGYLAIHFSLSLSKMENKVNPKKILIICNARRGDYLMIQHTFIKEFGEMIADLKIINALEIPYINCADYDFIFTTFLNNKNIPSKAIRINFFIGEKDIERIKKILLGVNETNQLIDFFKEEFFLGTIDAKTKEEVIEQLCFVANKSNSFDENLYEACLTREKLGSTAYGNYVALPHPHSLISNRTFVVTAILKKPILWSGEKVQLVFLICVEKGNKKDLTILFECISKLMMNSFHIQEIINKANYKTFIEKLKDVIN